MKKIINGKLYNTKTAHEVGCTGNNLSRRDFHYWAETLYKKRTGEYFLHGEGGALTKYAEWVGNMQCDGERIIPFTYQQATEWAEKNMDADDYQEEFGEVSEDGDGDTIIVKLSSADGAKLRRMAQERGISVTAMIESMINA